MRNQPIEITTKEIKVNEEKPYTHPTEDYYNIDLNTGKQIGIDQLFDHDENCKEIILSFSPYVEDDHFEIPFSIFENGVNTNVQLKPYAAGILTF
ncbi:MAG: hypothetical protein N4A62_02925 [Marinisporobacter sp.]|jgi:hypothetical protein|nr:hypothetical protein [Marinisporobacter sp.]